MNKDLMAILKLLTKNKEIDPKLVEAVLSVLRGSSTDAASPKGVNVVVNLLMPEKKQRKSKPRKEPKPSEDILAQAVGSSKAKEFVDNIASA